MKKTGQFMTGCLLVAQTHAATLYVDINNPNPVPPYSSWVTAATNIQAAVAVAGNGDTVLVEDGHYFSSYDIQINNSIVIQSVNGADTTVVDGNGVRRCFVLNNSACAVRGFTLTRGLAHNSDGGAVYSLYSSATVEDCTIADSIATYRGGGMNGGTAINCILTGNSANDGGGLYNVTATNCTLINNSAVNHGGGVYGGIARNCVMGGNSAKYGGGMAQGTIHNCVVSGNSASYGGGVYYGTANNCTMVGNEIQGSYNSTLNNCIIRESEGEDVLYGTIRNSCAGNLTHGTSGNITNAPLLVSVSHIATNSPCRGAGDAAYASGTDIDGEAWENPPSMGCDEKQPGETPSGAISFDLFGSRFLTLNSSSADYFVQVLGNVSEFRVDFDNGDVFTNMFSVSTSWDSIGSYAVVMTGINDDFPSGYSVTQMVQVADADSVAVYVAPTGDDANDGSSWGEAKATIQAGVDAQNYQGGIVRVTNGVYLLSSEILIEKNMARESVNGADATIVDGQGVCRGFNLGSSACVISGFTITNGYYYSNGGGGGIYCSSLTPLVENCRIVGNRVELGGGGMSNGTVSNCLIRGNSTRSNSGGGLSGSTANHCVISGNRSGSTGGGMGGGIANNCRIIENYALNGGGVYNGTLNNCVISGNFSDSVGGGMARGSATNCTVTGNTAAQEYGGIEYGKIYNCILFNNQPADTYYSMAYNSCAPGVTHGSNGNITNNPVLVSSSHIATNSPCVGMGNSLYASGTDIDGEAWRNPPSMGCDEKQIGETPTGEISLSLIGPISVVKDYSVNYSMLVIGNVSEFSVDFGNGDVFTNTFTADTMWSTTGSYPVVVSAYNDDYPSGVAVTQMVSVMNAEDVVIHVAKTGNDTNDGSSWALAMATLQAGIDAQGYEGGIVRVGDGHYIPANTIMISKSLSLQSVNGADSTLIDGNGTRTCLNLMGSACVVSGFTITNGYDIAYWGGGGVYCFDTTPVVEDCVIVNNRTYSGYDGGGMYNGTANRCIIKGNKAGRRGGGMAWGIVNNCIITGNTSEQYSGGVAGGIANNCLISGNTAGEGGGGMMNGTANNCTFTQNTTDGVGGGIWSGTANNCILFNNLPENAYSVSGFNSCAPELVHGSNGNITNNPMLVSSSHIAMNSPCRGAGNPAYASGTDIDGTVWQNPPSMGCDEKLAGELPSGDLSLSLNGPVSAINNYPTTYALQIVGNASGFSVDFDNGTVVGNQSWVTTQWPTVGNYDVVLSAYNDDHPAGVFVTQTVAVVDAENVVIHVSKTGNDANDGSGWAQAKATLQAGIDAQNYPGGKVLVGDGYYTPSATLSIKKDIVLQSFTDAASTIIDGGGSHSCFSLDADACIVSGFTITNGYNSSYGGGINCNYNKKPVIEDCTIVGNRSGYAGGGIFYGTANNCLLINNVANQNGGGSDSSMLNHCRISGNSVGYNGGGSYSGTLANCLVSGNSATNWAGGVYGGTLTNCTVAGNSSEAHFGGVYQPHVYNSIIWNNTTSGNSPNGSVASLSYSCFTPLPSGGTGNIGIDPQFVSSTDFHLIESSPCIDAGNNDSVSPTNDLEGNPRIINTIVDMGAYEYIYSSTDYDGDEMLNEWERCYGLDELDAADRLLNPDGDYFSNLQEFLCDTDPTNASSYFHITAISNGVPSTVYFDSSSDRLYKLLGCTNLVSNVWNPVQAPRMGTGGSDSMQSTNNLPNEFYKLSVELP